MVKLREELRAVELETSLAENIITNNLLHGSDDTTQSTQGEEYPGKLLQDPIVEAKIKL